MRFHFTRYFVNSIIFRVSHRLLYCVFIEVDFEKWPLKEKNAHIFHTELKLQVKLTCSYFTCICFWWYRNPNIFGNKCGDDVEVVQCPLKALIKKNEKTPPRHVLRWFACIFSIFNSKLRFVGRTKTSSLIKKVLFLFLFCFILLFCFVLFFGFVFVFFIVCLFAIFILQNRIFQQILLPKWTRWLISILEMYSFTCITLIFSILKISGLKPTLRK